MATTTITLSPVGSSTSVVPQPTAGCSGENSGHWFAEGGCVFLAGSEQANINVTAVADCCVGGTLYSFDDDCQLYCSAPTDYKAVNKCLSFLDGGITCESNGVSTDDAAKNGVSVTTKGGASKTSSSSSATSSSGAATAVKVPQAVGLSTGAMFSIGLLCMGAITGLLL